MNDKVSRVEGSVGRRVGDASTTTESPNRRTTGPTTLTPLMQQYHDLKKRFSNEILLFRLGDFYEMFEEDAKRASPILEVALTHRQQVPMCGVPAHSIDPYIAKLLKAGFRVAVADQLEDPATTKGLVKRDVVRVMTAGTLQEDTLLSAKQCNFLVALLPDKQSIGLAAIECSTGEFVATEIRGDECASRAWDELIRLGPSEVLLPSLPAYDALREKLRQKNIAVSLLAMVDFSAPLAEEKLKTLFATASLRGFGLEQKPLALAAAGAAVRYLENTQCGRPVTPLPLRTYDLDDSLQMDASTLDHLDLLPQAGGNRKTRSLLDVLDHTLTPMGGRLLRRWLVAPLRNVQAIGERQSKVAFFVEGREGRKLLRASLQGWPDMERILTRLVAGSIHPRDLSALGQGLRRAPKIKAQLAALKAQANRLEPLDSSVNILLDQFPEQPMLSDLLERAIVEGPPATMKEGGVIRPGYDAELDEVRSWIHDGKTRLLELEKREREQTGITTLKVGFNNVFGYFIEVTKTHLSKVPLNYVRKQTTANGERYITPELKEFENRILGAEERALRLEHVLVQDVREQILKASEALRALSIAVAELDFIVSLAEIAERRHYIRPIVDESNDLRIRDGRHPVLEDVLPAGTLVSNDNDLNGSDSPILILTGPNMSGKSTYLRQTALIAILAQMGSYVPASEAKIGVLDQLFTRIGASDRLTEGESTFMVEMVETARILNHATRRSLVILDEVGRGTSTYDGISIAWACLEFLHQRGPKVLFATHYFELTQLAQTWPGVKNAHVTAREWGDHVVFLHKVEPGPADRAYGIHVARLAGVPKAVLDRASILLKEFEKKRDRSTEDSQQPMLFDVSPAPSSAISGNQAENGTLLPEWVNDLEQLDVNQLTPMQALLKIQEWKEKHQT